MASALHRRKLARVSGTPVTSRRRKVATAALMPLRRLSGPPAACEPAVRLSSLQQPRCTAAAAVAAASVFAATGGPCCRAPTDLVHQKSCRALRRRLPLAVPVLASAASGSASHIPAPGPQGAEGALTVTARVVVPYQPTEHGQQLVLVGGCEALGNWDPNKGVRFNWCEGHSHVAEVELPAHATISCKLLVLRSDHQQPPVWEPESDRELLLAPTSLASRAAGYTLVCHWGFPDCTQTLTNSLRRGGSSSSGSKGSSSKVSSKGSSTGRSSSSPGLNGSSGHHNNHHNNHRTASSSDNPIIAGVKKALAHASSRDRFPVIPGITSSWEEDPLAGAAGPHAAHAAEVAAEDEDEEVVMVQCQVTVLLPRNGPKLRPDQSLVLVGSSPALGRWDPAHGLPLERLGGGSGSAAGSEPGSGEETSPAWTALAELPLGEGLQAKVVIVDSLSGQAQVWEPCENRSLATHLGSASRPVLITAYWGLPTTHCMEVDRLNATAAAGGNPQVVQLLRQQLAATSSQLDGLRRERDEARRAAAASGEHMRSLDGESLGDQGGRGGGLGGGGLGGGGGGRQEMVALAQQLQTTRRLYETTRKEALQLGGTVGVTRQLCDAAKRELAGLAAQLDMAKRAYEALAPQVERMERQLASTSRAFEATKPELAALETQLDRARGLLDRTLQKIEAAKALAAGDVDTAAASVARRRGESVTTTTRAREVQLARHF